MDRQSLADRIVVYCDTVVAFCVVNGFAFLVALGEPDIRCSIASVGAVIGALNFAVPVASTVALVWLRRVERRLRADREEDPDVADFFRIVVPLRLGLVWLFSLLVLGGIYAATFDPRCMALPA